MSFFKDQLREVSTILENHDLDIGTQEDGQYELVNKEGKSILQNISNFNEIHAILMGFEEGYQSAVQFYKVVKY